MEGYMSTTANAYISVVVSDMVYINKCNPVAVLRTLGMAGCSPIQNKRGKAGKLLSG